MSLHLRRALAAAALAAAALPGLCAQSQSQAPQPPGGPHEPPPEAYQACQGKAEGTSVTMTMPDGKSLQGTCRYLNGKLVAMPAGGPPPAGKAPSSS